MELLAIENLSHDARITLRFQFFFTEKPFLTSIHYLVCIMCHFNTIVIKMARWRLLFEKTISAILLDFSMVNFTLVPITLR